MLPSTPRLLAALFVGLLSSSLTTAQTYDTTHNVTSLEGTWSSGSGHVLTGPVSRRMPVPLSRLAWPRSTAYKRSVWSPRVTLLRYHHHSAPTTLCV